MMKSTFWCVLDGIPYVIYDQRSNSKEATLRKNGNINKKTVSSDTSKAIYKAWRKAKLKKEK
jgi:hypothetical protein